MDSALAKAITFDNLRARQAVLSENFAPRLDVSQLPLVDLGDYKFLRTITKRQENTRGLQLFHATERISAKLLMTPMRDAKVSGYALQEVHHRVGWYLATEFLGDVIGIEAYSISHFQGFSTEGYRICGEENTLIVALMRGGEPMASGVNEAFPRARQLHVHTPDNISEYDLVGISSIILVDSVVSSGRTIMNFFEHITSLDATIQIIAVVGVIHANSVRGSGFIKTLTQDRSLTIVALRLSDNQFTGSGTTDTGNRLFNTTHLC